METILPVLISYVSGLSVQYPAIVGVMAIAYTIGLVLKILRESIKKFVQESPSKSDDIKLEEFEKSKVSKAIYFLADLLIRFKK